MIAEFLSSLNPFALSPEQPEFNLNDPAAWDAFGATPSESGIAVTPKGAMSIAAVWQAMSVISGDVATSTANVFKRTGDGDREIDTKHPANYLISTKPNEEMSAFELMRRVMNHCLLWQNGYLYVARDSPGGPPVALYNLLPDRTVPHRDEDGTLFYVTEVDGKLEPIVANDVIHIKGMSIENDCGRDLVCAAKNCWGLALATEGFESKFFANGAQAGGVLELPVGISDPAAEKLSEAMRKKYTGKDNWFRVMVLRDGAKFHQMTVNARDAQLTEMREEQVRETARFFNLPPSKLGLKDSVSYNSHEQSQIQYITGCLTHWFGAIRGEMQIKLLSRKQQTDESHFIDFNTSKLVERDLKTQVEILAIERQNEIINAAEWRKKRNLSPRTDAAALEYINPNTKSKNDSANTDTEDESEPSNAQSNTPSKQPEPKPANVLSDAAVIVCKDAITRIARRVTLHARNASKNASKLIAWLDTGAYEHRELCQQVLHPASLLVAEMVGLDASFVCHAWRDMFFSRLVASLDPVTKAPFLSSDIEHNVDERCRSFESVIADDLVNSLHGSNRNANQTAA